MTYIKDYSIFQLSILSPTKLHQQLRDEVSFDFVVKNFPLWCDRPISQIVSNFNQISVDSK